MDHGERSANPQQPRNPAESPRLSRRAVLRGAALGGLAGFLAACGSTATPAPSAEATAVTSHAATPPPSGASSAEPSLPPPASPTPSTVPVISLAHKIAGLMVVGFRGSRLADAPWVAAALARSGLAGVILFDRDQLTGADRNILTPTQVKRLTADLRAAAGRRLVVSVDQEGGIVTRLGPKWGYPTVASEATIGSAGGAATRTWAALIATTLASNGFNLNFAPVVDLDVNPDSPAIGALDRSFSANPDVVVAKAMIEIDAHRAAGVRTTLKHFPGIGSSTTNTDFGVADVTETWTAKELEPFRQLIAAHHADLVMAGHVVNGQFDADHPASLSPTIVSHVLRGQLGWDGIVVTDDLQAAAITSAFGRDEAVLLALEAGNDLLLFANQQVYEPGVVARVVRIVSAAVRSGRIAENRIDDAYGRVQALFGGAAG